MMFSNDDILLVR